jgi:hypothetical protein
MKILHVYRNEANEDTKKLVEILNRDREVKEFKLYENEPNYDMLVQMIYEADQTVSWW